MTPRPPPPKSIRIKVLDSTRHGHRGGQTTPGTHLNIYLKYVSRNFTSRPNGRNAWISIWSSCAYPLTPRVHWSNVLTRLPHEDGNPTKSTGNLVPREQKGPQAKVSRSMHTGSHWRELQRSRRQTPPAALSLDAQQNFLRRLLKMPITQPCTWRL